MTRLTHSSMLLWFAIVILCSTILTSADKADAASFDTQVFRAAAVGLAVTQTAPALDRFINTFTLQNNMPIGMATKVVPILSVGDKGYVGAAQVSGPESRVRSVQAVWQYEDSFSQNEFRLKVLVPSSSLNPFEMRRVNEVGISAIIDVSLDGAWRGRTYDRSVGAGDVLKAGVMAAAINAAADPLNSAINSITGGSASGTKVVPIATIGDKGYIGGVQVSGSSSRVRSVRAVFQYEEIFDNGKFRIKVLVPVESTNLLNIRRVPGVGITALIDTSIARQETVNQRQTHWRNTRGNYRPIGLVVADQFRPAGTPAQTNQGLHKGWYIGKGNQRKMLSGVWVDRYRALSPRDQDAFVIWWNANHNQKPDILERRWVDWSKNRVKNTPPGRPASNPGQAKGRNK